MKDDEENPWFVENLEKFLYFCCPECDERNQYKDQFLRHALNQHPKAKQFLQNIEVVKKKYGKIEEIQNNAKVMHYGNNIFEKFDQKDCEIKEEFDDQIMLQTEHFNR